MGLLEVSLVGVSYATSRWTLTTMLFKAIKRINLSCGSKTCFYTSNEDSVILRIKRRWMHSTGFVCYIPSLFVLLLLLSPFLWRSNSCKKVFVLYDKDILLMLFSLRFFFINVWLGGFICCFSYVVSVNFLVLVLAVVFFIASFSMVYHLGFVLFSVSWLFDSILCVFSELF